MTHVAVSGRVLDKQVGGNTRYAREVYSRLHNYGVSHSISRPRFVRDSTRSAQYALFEGVQLPALPPADADVLHFPADTGAWSRGRRPIVATVHGLATMHIDGVRSRRGDAVWRTRVGALVRAADRIITVSESSARDISKAFPGSASRIVPILHGIDHELFKPDHDTPAPPVLREHGVLGRYFAYVGNIDPRKNVVELCRAATTVFSQHRIPTVISGSPAWDSSEIMDAIASSPGVIYLGRTSDEDMVAILRNALAFCFPSRYEGFGFPVLEAMACGTPVICSDRGSLAEIAEDSALVLKNIDAKSIATAMSAVIEDSTLRADLTSRGLQRAQEFTWEKSARMHASVFREVAP